MGKTTVFLVFLFLTLSAVEASSCETKISFGHSKCSYYVKYPNSSCDSFVFQKCSFPYCSGSGKHRSCDSNEYSTDWNLCSNKCCDINYEYHMTWDDIKQCQDYLNDKALKGLDIAMFTLLALAILILLVVCCCCEYHRSEVCQEARNNIKGFFALCSPCLVCLKYYLWGKCLLRYQLEENPDLQINEEKARISKSHSYVNWNISGKQNEDLTKVCGICIKYGVSLVLNCGHVYHPRCLTGWLKIKLQCPKCECSITPVRVYCQSCATSYYQKDSDISLVSRKRQICSECKESGMINEIPE